ncbi:MAG: vWA domain-containing protein [Vulcanimicrobiota bacterium]
MKSWLWVGFLLIGCQTAQPQPNWTPPQVQLLSEGKKNGRYTENDRENLAVSGPPRPRPTPTSEPLSVKPVAVRPGERQPELPNERIPSGVAYHHHSDHGSSVEVTTTGDVPLISTSEGNLLEAIAETGVDDMGNDGQGHIVFVTVEIAPKGPQISAGCDLALLVDVSGSVFYGQMDSAVRATSDVYAQQGSGNRTWLIAFGTGAQMLVDGLQSVPTGHEIGRLLRGSREAGGGTQLGPALDLALGGLRKAPSGKARHMVVVSDGALADTYSALATAEEAWKKDGISCSAIMVGRGQPGTLRELAEHCNGEYTSAESMTGAGQLLKGEAARARSIILRDLRLQASLPAGVTLRRAFQVEPVREVVTSGKPQETLKLGDLHRNERRRVLLELQVKPGAGRERALAWLSVLSKGADAKERSPQVLPQVRVGNTNRKPTTNPAVDRTVDAVYRVVTRK